MREGVLYMRGAFPFSIPPGIPDGLIRDAKVLLGIDEEVLTAVRGDLEAFAGFLDERAIKGVLTSHIQNADACDALTRLIAGIDSRLRGLGQTLKAFLSQIDGWLNDKENQTKGLLAREEFDHVKARLLTLIQPYPGLNRQAKAERLSAATGLPLEKVDIICDLRPVFDESRERVEGIIPFTTLRVVCKGVDGLPVAIEAILTQQDVVQLAEASAAAKKKLTRLRRLLQEKDLAVPSVGVTMEGDGA